MTSFMDSNNLRHGPACPGHPRLGPNSVHWPPKRVFPQPVNGRFDLPRRLSAHLRQIGLLAPILLVFLRLCQGFSASGEQAGANSMTLEHAPPNRRAFFTSFTLSGTQAGSILATAVFLPVSWLPEDQLLSWGWRVPFWLSVVVVAIGYFIRRTLAETPAFLEEKQQHEVPKLPLAILFSQYTTDVVRVVLCALVSTVSTIFGVYALSYAVNTVEIDRSTMLWVGILTNFVALAAIPLFATLSDRVGRKPVYVFGALVPATLMFHYLWAIGEARIPLIFIFGILMSGVAYSASNGIWPSFYGEMFSTRVRLSGMAIGTQIGFAIRRLRAGYSRRHSGRGPEWMGAGGPAHRGDLRHRFDRGLDCA